MGDCTDCEQCSTNGKGMEETGSVGRGEVSVEVACDMLEAEVTTATALFFTIDQSNSMTTGALCVVRPLACRATSVWWMEWWTSLVGCRATRS